MTKIKLNLASGSVQERELVTAFKCNGVKYIVFDGESTGSMGLPIILVGKENYGKVVGITDADEWKTTKECLKNIISGSEIEYAHVEPELSADDVYYRQLTLPIESFDLIKSSYVAPSVSVSAPVEDIPVFQVISPEEIAPSATSSVEPVAVSASELGSSIELNSSEPTYIAPVEEAPVNSVEMPTPEINNYDELKKEFVLGAEKLFDELYNKLR